MQGEHEGTIAADGAFEYRDSSGRKTRDTTFIMARRQKFSTRAMPLFD